MLILKSARRSANIHPIGDKLMALTAEDRISIQQVTAKYAIAMDDADMETWLSTWDERGIWEGGPGKFEGHEQLRQLFPALGDRVVGKRHVVSNFVIEGEGEAASQQCYLLVMDRKKEHLPWTLVYKDTLQKKDGNWRFVHRRATLD
jgi:3-phenylpropionate/cinnamic acid dioxygenase small subunit